MFTPSRTTSRVTTFVRLFSANKFARDALSLSLGRGLNLLLGFASVLMFGIVFSKPQIGTISLYEMVLGLVLTMGITWSAIGVPRYGKEELSTYDTLNRTSTLRLCLIAPVTILVLVSVLVFRQPLMQYLGTDQPGLILCLAFYILVSALHDHLSSLHSALEDHATNAAFFVGQSVAKLTILSLFVTGLIAPNVVGFMAAIVGADMLLVLLLWLRLPHYGTGYILPLHSVRWDQLRQYIRYVYPQFLGFAGIYVINWIDVYYIRKYCSMDDLGAYQFLYSIFVKLTSFALIANTILFPRILVWKEKDEQIVRRFARSAPMWVFLVVCLATFAALPIFPVGFDLFFGEKYVDAYSSLAILLCSLPCIFCSYTLIPIMNSFDQVKRVQAVNIAAACCNLALDAWLVPAYGIVGAALATFAAFWTKSLLLIPPIRRRFNIGLKLTVALHVALAVVVVSLFGRYTH
ncbi:MAG: polysaccharide biosynthesis C-terminal domain-containing protein [Pirellulaceae bacterium]|nr:polysaccharide biosynthesis C-terminal domain-containing protein [Pirellulaceae bacterium]